MEKRPPTLEVSIPRTLMVIKDVFGRAEPAISHPLPSQQFKNDTDSVFIDHEQHQHLDPFSA